MALPYPDDTASQCRACPTKKVRLQHPTTSEEATCKLTGRFGGREAFAGGFGFRNGNCPPSRLTGPTINYWAFFKSLDAIIRRLVSITSIRPLGTPRRLGRGALLVGPWTPGRVFATRHHVGHPTSSPPLRWASPLIQRPFWDGKKTAEKEGDRERE